MVKTMQITAGGAVALMAEYTESGDTITILKVYRRGSGHVFTEPVAKEIAINAIRGVKAGWLKIGK